jgi:murein DD-endopeptidase MepM/ murein hydrolase activator NlpD
LFIGDEYIIIQPKERLQKTKGMPMAEPTSHEKTDDADCPGPGKHALLFAAFICVFFLNTAVTLADIYRYLDENGMECFTDTPAKSGAVMIIKEAKSPGQMVSTLKEHRTAHSIKKGKSGPAPAARSARSPLSAAILPVHGLISSNVGMRYDPIDGLLRHHNGVDIAVPAGTPVKPVLPGVVSYSGFRHGYGNEVIILHDDGMITLYAHNSTNLVKEGIP